MKRILGLLIPLLALTPDYWSQIPTQFLLARDTSFRASHSLILFDGDAAVGSPVMDKRFFSTMAFGGELHDWHTSALLFGMDQINRAGMKGNTGIHFYGFSDTLTGHSDWGLQAAASSHWYAQTGFSNGLFELVFKGNSAHVGDSMILGPFSGEYQAWQKFGVGIFNKKTFSGARLSLVSGQDYRRLEVRDAMLYTSPLADSLSLSYTGDYMRADTSNRGWGSGNGFGFSLDLEFNKPLASGTGFITLSVHDLGWVGWNRQTEFYQFDSISSWKGYHTDDLFSPSEEGRDPVWRDSLHLRMERGVKWRMLPFRVQMRMMKYYSANSLFDFSIALQPGHYSVPLVQAGLSHFFGDHLIVSERVGVGGYGTISLGAEVQWMPHAKWYLRAGSNNMAGFFSRSARSVDAFATLACFFGRNNITNSSQ